MFLGITQLNQLLLELSLNAHKFDVENIAKDIKKKGALSKYLSFTDQDNQQVCIELSENVYIYSQQTCIEYDWGDDDEIDVGDYFTETYDFENYSKESLNDGVSNFYSSLERLKEEVPDNWKQIALECIFEEEAMGN